MWRDEDSIAGAKLTPICVAQFPSAFSPSFGGVEELSAQLGRELERRGHRVRVVTNRWPRKLAVRERLEGLDVVRPAMRVGGGSLKSKANAAITGPMIRRQLAGDLRRFGADLIHVICVSSNAGYALHAARRLGLPLVVTAQGELTMDATRLYERSSAARERLGRLLDAADAVTGCSRQVLDELERWHIERGGMPFEERGRVIYNGIRVADFAGGSGRPHGSQGRPYVLGIGRQVREKGFDILLRAYRRLVESWDDHEGVPGLVLVGDGPERDSLEKSAGELGLNPVCRHHDPDILGEAGRGPVVVFPGRAGRAAALSWLKGASAVVLSSRHEPFGIVNLEAMAAGSPVIATRVGGVPEFVTDGENGLLVEPESPEAIGKALARVLGDEALAEGLRARGLETAESFDWSAITDQYEEVYDRVLRRRG